jgi:hypothetical protein
VAISHALSIAASGSGSARPVVVADFGRGGQATAAHQFLAVGKRHHVIGP